MFPTSFFKISILNIVILKVFWQLRSIVHMCTLLELNPELRSPISSILFTILFSWLYVIFKNLGIILSAKCFVKGNNKQGEGDTCNVVDDSLLCILFSLITILTFTGNVSITESKGRYKLLEDKGVPNAILSIDEVVMDDRGTYTCFAKNIANHTEASTFVRVKDKLAALWPFLGICAEVFVLCAIILIYEKKRNKAELEESDTDQSPEQKNTPDHGKDSDVRQRK
ncbi:hypothetical protein J437_LFUL003892 [Ladona fulva]|uniref:Basigin n=1 Tax=Ladona fulva TaxID=123851 RepID=A0A8K0K6H8_LADFU|nr:hypothetical protein J437_LFUL003892 [Ladona fulva]